MYALEAKKSEFLVHLDCFSKFLKYFKYFEKQSKLTKNSDFFAHGERATLSHHFGPSCVSSPFSRCMPVLDWSE